MIENPSKLGTTNFTKKDGAFSLSKANRPINALAPSSNNTSECFGSALSLLNSHGCLVSTKAGQIQVD